MSLVGAQKFSVEQTIIEKGCVETDAVIVSLADLFISVQETNNELLFDMLGEMHMNFAQATEKIENQLASAKRVLSYYNYEVRNTVSNAKAVEQDALDQIGG